MKLKCFLFIILLINIVSINIYSKDKYSEDVIKIGVYENAPYYSIDSNGKVSGYYDDFFKILRENYNFKYEYVICDFEDRIDYLPNGKIDTMFRISIKSQRIDKWIFSKNFIAIENFELLTNKDYQKLILKQKILFIILSICILLIVVILAIPKIKNNRAKNKIKTRINNNKYLLQYQPIYNPRNNTIVGFEGLLRLLDENNKLIPPYQFIPEIEKNDMLFDISLWVLERVINDYNDIKNYNCVRGQEFYISLNLSLQEIENDAFIKKAINMLNESHLGSNKICLEIIERAKINDLDKISENINILKNVGFKIAIDDFGVEYSNLDILHTLDTDVIKVDKNFVDGIEKDMVKNEIILFISTIAKAKNKAVVLEGVEKKEQDIRIKEIENDKIYVQGYFYNKPMYKEDIKKL